MRSIALLMVGLVACESSHAAPRSATSDREALVRAHMRAHYNMLGAIQHLVIRDDLYDAAMIARTISNQLNEPSLGYAGQAQFARANARELADAPNIEEACRATARLAATCANCHVDAHVTRLFGSPPPAPAEGKTVDARMARHTWATDRLFEGIIGGADDSWLAGLDVLAQTPSPSPDARRATLARRLQDLAQQTRKRGTKDDFGARARAYGEILIACSACHATDRKPTR